MLRNVRPRLNHSTVVAYLALLVALGGTSYAAVRLDGHDLKDGSVGGAKLADRTIKAVKIRHHTLTPAEFSAAAVSSLRGPKGDRGPRGARGAKGFRGPRGPSDVYEAVQSNSSVVQEADHPLSIQLTGLPPGSYAIFAKASLGPLTNNPGRDTGQCTLTAGTDQDRAIDDWEEGEQSFKTIDTALTHSFTSAGTATLSCTVNTENFEMGLGVPDDTRIIAVRVDNRTSARAAIG